METGGPNSGDMCGNSPGPGGIQNLIQENPELGHMLLYSAPHKDQGHSMNRPPALCTPALEMEGRPNASKSARRQCPLCLKYLTIDYFTKHFQQEKKKRYCKSCKCSFEDIAEHVEERHEPLHFVPFYGKETRLCRVCGRRYVTEHRYAAHMLAQHGTAAECSQQSLRSAANQCSPSLYTPLHQGPGTSAAMSAANPHQQTIRPYVSLLNTVPCPLCLLRVPVDKINEHCLEEESKSRRRCKSCACPVGGVSEHLRKAHNIELVKPAGWSRSRKAHLSMRCDVCCELTGSHVTHMISHIRKRHIVNMKAQCMFCLQSLRQFTPKEIEAHSERHRRKWCLLCSKQITRTTLSEHKAEYHGLAKGTCDLCGLIMPVGQFLLKHFNYHYDALINTNSVVIEPKSSKCDICGYIVTGGYYQHMLWNHIRCVHGLAECLYCDICKKKFKGVHSLARHVGYAHLPHIFNYTCPKCNEIVVPTSWTAPITHKCTSNQANPLMKNGPRRKPHGYKFRDRYCDICGTRKTGAHSTKDHIFSVHLGIRKPKTRFLCIICGKLISTSIKKYHLEKTHRNHRPAHV